MRKILVVDGDDWMSRLAEALTGSLTSDWKTSFSRDAADAIAVAEQGDTEVIVVNTVVNYPDMSKVDSCGMNLIPNLHISGVRALRAIKERNPDQRVIMMTSVSGSEDHIRSFCKNEGAEAVLVKPFSPDELVDLILRPSIV